jgi:hypothetical protein
MQNKPSCPKRGTEAVSAVAPFGSPQYSIIPPFQSDAYRAKQSQFWAGPGPRRAKDAKQSQSDAFQVWGFKYEDGQGRCSSRSGRTRKGGTPGRRPRDKGVCIWHVARGGLDWHP